MYAARQRGLIAVLLETDTHSFTLMGYTYERQLRWLVISTDLKM